MFLERLMLEMKATPVSFFAHKYDCITWSSSPSGNFEMKEAYRLARLEAEAIYVMIVLMVSGFGGCLLSPKSNASYGNATIKASLLAPCLLPGEWKFQPFVGFVTQVLKQSYMF